MKIGFIGCHDISWHCLKAICYLLDSGDELVYAINYDNKRNKIISSYADFNYFEKKYSIPVHYVDDVNTGHGYDIINKVKLDILFIIGWHRIVSGDVLSLAKTTIGQLPLLYGK
jgi:methionyl-tRNA formyltransferase